MSRRDRWIYSLDGQTQPADAQDDFTSRQEAVDGALAAYWTEEDRKVLRDQYAKTGGFKLKFYVGQVHRAVRMPIPGHRLIDELGAAQSATSDMPMSWPPDGAQDIKNLEVLVDAAVEAWLRGSRSVPEWDEVKYELVEVEA